MASGSLFVDMVLSGNKIKEIKKLHLKKYRDEYNMFILEGKKALDDALSFGVDVLDIFTSKPLNYSHLNVTNITEEEMKKISTTSSPCEVLAVAKKKIYEASELKKLKTLILLDSISDPGNLGTIIRSAAAFGVEGIILFSSCVDYYSPKVIRSCAGNFFKIPIVELPSLKDLKNDFADFVFVSTDISQKNNIELKEVSKLTKKIIMFGSEAHGLSDDLIKLSTKNIKLDMKNNVDSLNLAVCASVILYEISKF